jgi:hypothetical protein
MEPQLEATRKPNKRHPKARPRARGFRLPPAVLDYIAENDQKAVPPKQILNDVAEKFPDSPVSPRTLTRVLAGQRAQRRDGEHWSPREGADGVDVALTVPAIAHLIEWSEGRRRELTIGEARRITFVRRAAPDIPIPLAFKIAQMYGRTTPENVLDSFLAFAPWRGERERLAYRDAIKQNWLPRGLLGAEENE